MIGSSPGARNVTDDVEADLQIAGVACPNQVEVVGLADGERESFRWDRDPGVVVIVEVVDNAILADRSSLGAEVVVDVRDAVLVDSLVVAQEVDAFTGDGRLYVGTLFRCEDERNRCSAEFCG